ncbi:MAG TPA: methyltransferase, partial [Hyphomicrobiaceae bacterium]|nr:methyltransferase [Hyphomicrobiaceae bacterium]
PGGTVRMIHRAEALVEVLDVVGRRFGDVTVRPIHARAGEAARRILVSGRKGSKGPLRILPALVLHGHAGNAFRPDIQAILQGPVALQQA